MKTKERVNTLFFYLSFKIALKARLRHFNKTMINLSRKDKTLEIAPFTP